MKKLLFLFLLLPFLCLAQTPMHFLVDGPTPAAGGPTPPTFQAEYETAWNTTTTPKTTASVSVQTGDVLVAYSIVEDHSSAPSVSGGSLTWTLAQEVNVTNFTRVALWTTTATSTTSFTVSFARTATAKNFGGNVLVFRGSDGVGASNKTNTTGAPSLSLTTSFANSIIVCVVGDWDADDGSTRTWRTVNGITPVAGGTPTTEPTYQNIASTYTVYAAYYTNAGAAGAKTVGLSAPSAMTYSIAAVEIRGH